MKNLKSLVALLVVAAMMFGSVAAMASYGDVDANATYATAVDTLSALSILMGDDQGNFNPDKTITRAESAAVIVRALGLEEAAKGAAGATQFTDVATNHWGSGYINMAAQTGIIKGHGDGTFGPEDPVTYEQIVKMLVCALGYEPRALVKGGYPTGYLIVANDTKLSKGVSGNAGEPALRKVVAQLVFNGLDIPLMEQEGYGADATYVECHGRNGNDYKTLLTAKLDVYKIYGEVEETDATKPSLKEGTVEYQITKNENVGIANDDFAYNAVAGIVYAPAAVVAHVGNTNAKNLLGYTCYAYLKPIENSSEYEIVAINQILGVEETIEIAAEDINSVTSSAGNFVVDYDVADDSDEVTILGNAIVYLNGVKVNLAPAVYNTPGDPTSGVATPAETYTTGLFAPFEGSIKLFLNDDENAVKVFVEDYRTAVVDSVAASNQTIVLKTPGVTLSGALTPVTTLKLDTEANKKLRLSIKDAEGKDMKVTDLQEWDVLSVKANARGFNTPSNRTGNNVEIIVARKAIDGQVTGTKTIGGTTTYTVGGEGYKLAANGFDLASVVHSAQGTFYLNAFGKIAGINTSTAVNIDNYAVILNSDTLNMDDYAIKVLGKDGLQTYTLSSTRNVKFNGVSGTTAAAAYASVSSLVSAMQSAKAALIAAETASPVNPLTVASAKAAYEAAIVALMASVKVNNDGIITEIDFTNIDGTPVAGKYKSGTIAIGATDLNSAAKVYYVPAKGAATNADYVVKDVTTLNNDSTYAAYTFGTNATNEVTAILITDSSASASDTTPVALVTATGATLDEDGVQVDELTYYSEGQVATVLADSGCGIGLGDLIQIVLNSEGKVDLANTKILANFNIADVADNDIYSAGADLPNVASSTNPKRSYFYGHVTAKNTAKGTITMAVSDSSLSDAPLTKIIALNPEAKVYTIDRNEDDENIFVPVTDSSIDDITEDVTLSLSPLTVEEHYIFAELDDSDNLVSVIVILPYNA